jgi:hypothetical protein
VDELAKYGFREEAKRMLPPREDLLGRKGMTESVALAEQMLPPVGDPG